MFAVDLSGLGQHFLSGKVACGALHEQLVIGELEIHNSTAFKISVALGLG